MGRSIKQPRKGKTRYSIIADGETEKWYFERMKEYESLPVSISPVIGKKTLDNQYNLVRSHANDYDHVYWIIDLDVIIAEDRKTKRGEKSVVENLKKYLKELEIYKNVEVIINNPGLEIWFLMHYKRTSKYFSCCHDVIKELHKTTELSDYEKSEKYYKKTNNCIYKRLNKSQATGIANSEALGIFNVNEDLEKSKSEIYKIVKKILNKD